MAATRGARKEGQDLAEGAPRSCDGPTYLAQIVGEVADLAVSACRSLAEWGAWPL